MTVSRRDILKSQAAAVAATVANMSLPALAQPVAGGIGSLEIQWSKAPCRFCGTGCGVMVGVKEGKVVATHGDTLAEVNRGLNCIKGYFLSKIMYGGDRLTTPLLRKRGGVYAKDGRLQEAHQRVRELSTEDVERRLAHALLKLAHEAGVTNKSGVEIDFPVSRQDLAEMTAATLHTVSRIMSSWEAAGILEGGRQRVAIRDEQKLRTIAEGDEPGGG